MIRSPGISAIALLVVGAAACTPLPDTSGYTAASSQLKQSAAAVGTVMHDELARTTDRIPGEQNRARLATATINFDNAWHDTVGSLSAMADYAQSVEDLTNAGNHGADSARQLSQSVLSLAGAVGIAPGAAVAGAAVDTFALLNSAVANIRASRSLTASLAAADPLMQDIAVRVKRQVDAAEHMFNVLISQQRVEIDAAYGRVRNIDDELRRQEIDAAANATGSGDSALQANLTRLRDARALMAPRVAEYQAAVETVATRERAGRNLFLATRTALQSWADSHSRLVRAVQERRPVSFQSLMAASQDVRDLVQRWRDL
ncbi:MAG: hypothetical protein JO276_09990 [Sphingomonadaceae bacterium]|nr:hypothetical protein [Sphingomonadaceae bacterium]